MFIICWLKTIWCSLQRLGFYQDGIQMSGHDFVEKEVHHNKTVSVLECEKCGEITINWE